MPDEIDWSKPLVDAALGTNTIMECIDREWKSRNPRTGKLEDYNLVKYTIEPNGESNFWVLDNAGRHRLTPSAPPAVKNTPQKYVRWLVLVKDDSITNEINDGVMTFVHTTEASAVKRFSEEVGAKQRSNPHRVVIREVHLRKIEIDLD